VLVVVARPLASRNGVKLKVGGGAVVVGERIEEAASAVAVAIKVAIMADLILCELSEGCAEVVAAVEGWW
jgi:hypothetical protein